MTSRETTMKAMGLMMGYWISQSLHAIAELAIADLFTTPQQQISVESLAQQSNTNADSLYRLMRALTGVDVFKEVEPRVFELGEMGVALQSSTQGSLRDMMLTMLGGEHFQGWTELVYCVKTGNNAMEKLYNAPFFQYVQTNPERATLFNNTMTIASAEANAQVSSGYDFKPYKVITDIGGGHGSLLRAVLATTVDNNGIVFDLPHVVEEGKKGENADLNGRVEFQGGDFFQTIPHGSDLYMMKWIIHDWNDEKSLIILKNVRQAMKETSKLLIIDSVVKSGNDFEPAKFMDLNMMVLVSGKERSRLEFEQLLSRSGFKLNHIYNEESRFAILECLPE